MHLTQNYLVPFSFIQKKRLLFIFVILFPNLLYNPHFNHNFNNKSKEQLNKKISRKNINIDSTASKAINGYKKPYSKKKKGTTTNSINILNTKKTAKDLNKDIIRLPNNSIVKKKQENTKKRLKKISPINETADLEEVLIYVNIKDLGNFEIPAYINQHKILLPLIELFDLLKIKNEPSDQLDSIKGWFVKEPKKYLINIDKKEIVYLGKYHHVKPIDIIKTDTEAFLKSDYLEEIFGIKTIFSFRNLSAKITCNIEVPAVTLKRQEKIRENLNTLYKTIKPDSILESKYKFFDFGMLNWRINSVEQVNGTSRNSLYIAAGGQLFGGEFSGSLNHTFNRPFIKNQQQYLWGKVNNDAKIIKQFYLGKVATNSTATLSNPIVGGQITNMSTEQDTYFGSYIINEQTTPGWKIELYINQRLIDYTEADANGFFSFEVPIIYGNMNISLKYYGPWGEFKTVDKEFKIPYNFVPKNKFQYTATAGILEDGFRTTYAKFFGNYGLTSNITVGLGMEHLSSINTPFMPFVKSSVRINNDLLLNTEYIHNIKQSATVNWDLPNKMKLIYQFINYNKDQEAIINNFKTEQYLSINKPFKIYNQYLFSRFNLSRSKLKNISTQNEDVYFSNAEAVLSFHKRKIGIGLTSNIFFYNSELRNYSNKISLSHSLPKRLNLMLNTNYNHTNNKFQSLQFLAQKKFSENSFLSSSYEYNFNQKVGTFNLTFVYGIDAALLSSSINTNKNSTKFINTLSGSIAHNSELNYTQFNRVNRVGNSGFVFIPFLDVNRNGVKENNEQIVENISISTKGGFVQKNVKDTTIVALNLRPYKKYNVTINSHRVDNISWQSKYKNIQVSAKPNELKTVYVPIYIAGEVAGYVYLNNGKKLKGFYGIKLDILKNGKKIAETTTEMDGYFSYLGLAPDKYTIRVNKKQAEKLNIETDSKEHSFEIKSLIDGDFVDGIKFICHKK